MQQSDVYIKLVDRIKIIIEKLIREQKLPQWRVETKLDFIATLLLRHLVKLKDLSDNDLISIIIKEHKSKNSNISIRNKSSAKSYKERKSGYRDNFEDEIDKVDNIDSSSDSEDNNENSDTVSIESIDHTGQSSDTLSYDFEGMLFFKNDEIISYIQQLIQQSSLSQTEKEKVLNFKGDIVELVTNIINNSNLNIDDKEIIIGYINDHKIKFIFELIDSSSLNFIEKESLKSFYDKAYDSFVLKNFTTIGKSRIYSEAYQKAWAFKKSTSPGHSFQ